MPLFKRRLSYLSPKTEVSSLNTCKLIRSFFTSLLKPFVWDFPVIYFLDKNNYDYLNSPVPIIIGVDSDSSEFKFRLNLLEISSNILIYNIQDDILETGDLEIKYPKFSERIWKLQKRYYKLGIYIKRAKNIRKKQLILYSLNFLKKFR